MSSIGSQIEEMGWYGSFAVGFAFGFTMYIMLFGADLPGLVDMVPNLYGHWRQ
jgi:hypothetical protein